MSKRTDITGNRYGRLTAVEYAGKQKWRCVCDCGNTTEVVTSSLRRGASTSCGCFRREHTIAKNTTHGMAKTPAYLRWKNIMQRCYNPNNPGYPDYGGRGVRVCDRWHDFAAYHADMGNPPAGMSLDRVDVNGDYEPDNCRWASAKIQARNKRNSIRVDGIELVYLAQELGIPYATLHARLWNAKRRAESEGTS
jgi:hypothetical protein